MDTEIIARPENGLGKGNALTVPAASSVLAKIPEKAQGLLLRMFTDPYLLEKAERADLVAELRESVMANPRLPELRVLFGMALCVNFEVPDAIEELRVAVQLDPQSFIAQMKMGELWMRLRVMDKAEEHTRQAALLAQNLAQSELARRQAASIRAMKQAGIERGGYKNPRFLLARLSRLWTRNRTEALAADVR
jgi:tetratricopeptide (TPR) repeat protein